MDALLGGLAEGLGLGCVSHRKDARTITRKDSAPAHAPARLGCVGSRKDVVRVEAPVQPAPNGITSISSTYESRVVELGLPLPPADAPAKADWQRAAGAPAAGATAAGAPTATAPAAAPAPSTSPTRPNQARGASGVYSAQYGDLRQLEAAAISTEVDGEGFPLLEVEHAPNVAPALQEILTS